MYTRVRLGVALTMIRELSGAIEVLEQAKSDALAAGFTDLAVQSLHALSVVQSILGDAEAIRTSLDEMLRLAEKLSLGDRAYAYQDAAHKYKWLFEYETALRLIDRSLELYTSTDYKNSKGQTPFLPSILARRGELLGLLGRDDEALEAFGQAERVAKELGDPYWEALLL